jgi:AcrR family transcriptional regulator
MIAVAEEMFAERGYQAAAMDEIAERVGVSKPMLYEYFGSKQGLFLACIRQARAELLAVTTQAVSGVDSAEEALRSGLLAFFEFTDSHRRSWELIRHEATVAGQAAVDEIEAIRQQQTALQVALFATYLPDAPLSELEAASEILVGACERLSTWYVQQDDISAKQAADHVMQVFWFGLRGRLDRST